MKSILFIFLASLPLVASANGIEEEAETTLGALSPEIEIYNGSNQAMPRTSEGLLEDISIAIGTILKSHHFDKDKYDYHDYNESHDGVYLRINDWSAGTYINSADARSVFLTYHASLYRSNSIMVDLVSGVANGYEGWENAQGDYLPILGVSAQWMYLKSILTYEAVTLGLELPLN